MPVICALEMTHFTNYQAISMPGHFASQMVMFENISVADLKSAPGFVVG